MDDVLIKPFSARDLQRTLQPYVVSTGEPERVAEDLGPLISEETLIAIAKINPESGMALVDQVVSLFEQQSPTFINDIEQATRAKDAAQTRRLAHGFKSSALNIGAVILGKRLAEIEAAARDDGRVLTSEEASALGDLVRDSLRQLLAAYMRLSSENPNGV